MKKTAMLLGVMFISTNCGALEKTLRVITAIDINNLYADAITKVQFDPAILELEVSADQKKFVDQTTTLKIETDIPKSVTGVAYTSTLVNNSARCVDYVGNTTPQPDFVAISFDGELVQESDVVRLDDFSSDDGTFKYSEHRVELAFSPFASIAGNGIPQECSGDVEFRIGVDL